MIERNVEDQARTDKLFSWVSLAWSAFLFWVVWCAYNQYRDGTYVRKTMVHVVSQRQIKLIGLDALARRPLSSPSALDDRSRIMVLPVACFQGPPLFRVLHGFSFSAWSSTLISGQRLNLGSPISDYLGLSLSMIELWFELWKTKCKSCFNKILMMTVQQQWWKLRLRNLHI